MSVPLGNKLFKYYSELQNLDIYTITNIMSGRIGQHLARAVPLAECMRTNLNLIQRRTGVDMTIQFWGEGSSRVEGVQRLLVL
jgi:hypothetical protein